VFVFILVLCMSLFMSQMLIHVTIDTKQINVGWCSVRLVRVASRCGWATGRSVMQQQQDSESPEAAGNRKQQEATARNSKTP